MNKASIKFIAAFLGLFVIPASALAQPIDPNFNPGFLISDEAFADTSTFGNFEGVQKFLESKNSVLARTDAAFLILLREPSSVVHKTGLDDPRPNLDRLRTAAELIYDAAQAASINAQVLLVTLQKEQSLITKNFIDPNDLQRALDRALGYGCPDGAPCGANFLGFYNQLFGNFDAEGNRWIGAARSLSRSFTFTTNGSRTGRGPLIDASNQAFGAGPFVRPSIKGDTVTFQNTLGGFDNVQSTQIVTLSNYATAALYRYTPHVFNGNYNFWRFYQAWFRYPNGTVIKLFTDSNLWVIDNGFRRQFSTFVASQRGINISSPIVVSPTEFNSYVEGTRLVPKDGTLIRGDLSGVTYLIEGGKKRETTAFTASQRNLNLASAVTLSEAEVNLYESGTSLLPLEGTLIRPVGDGTVYVMVGEQKRYVSYQIFLQRKYSAARINTVPAEEVAKIATGNPMPPMDNTLVQGQTDRTVYVVAGGTKRYISYPVWLNRRFTPAQILQLSDVEVNVLTTGLPLPPVDNTLVQGESELAVYLVQGGSKAYITYMVYLLRGFNRRPILKLSDVEIASLPTKDRPLPPPDGTLVKASDDMTIYLVQGGQLRYVTYEAWVARRFNIRNVKVFDPQELNLYEKGELIAR